jgi:Cys-rich four helix bundle protein (predicted Tat secretion target)
MDRRLFIVTAGAAALIGTAAGPAASQERQDASLRQAVVDACADCMKTGEACLAMCNEMLRHGMTDVAECHARVVDMLAMCEAMGSMAAANASPPTRLKALAALCADTCRDCARACEPQAARHAECKTCMDDAAACAQACDTFNEA